MSYRRKTDIAIAEFATNLAQILAEHKVGCLSDAKADEFAAELGPLGTALSSDVEESSVAKNAWIASNSRKHDRRVLVVEAIAEIYKTIRAHRDHTAVDLDVCGFKNPRKWTRVVAKDPKKLSAADIGDGRVKIKFAGNNPRNSVGYEIWRREGKAGPWMLICTIRKQSHIDKPQNRGRYYEYKVRAVASSTLSSFSNVGAVNTYARIEKVTQPPV